MPFKALKQKNGPNDQAEDMSGFSPFVTGPMGCCVCVIVFADYNPAKIYMK